MKTNARLRMLGALITAAALAWASAPVATAAPPGAGVTCGDENPNLSSGTYSSLTVAGWCVVEDGAEITVTGNVTVKSLAFLNAENVASLTVGKNLTMMADAAAQLGNDIQGSDYSISIAGNVTATDPAFILISRAEVGGNVTLTGGGTTLFGGATLPFAVIGSKIKGNLSASGQTVSAIGFTGNTVRGNLTLSDITVVGPEQGTYGQVYVSGNHTTGNLSCTGLVAGPTSISPTTQLPEPNIVGRKATGQCAGEF